MMMQGFHPGELGDGVTFSEIGRVGSGGRKGKGAQIKGSV